MLTLYYAGATILQGWRIKSLCQKISEQLAQQASISFYTLPAATDEDGFDISMATSDRCVNRNGSKVSQILWLHNNQRGCCLLPLQTIETNSWITFPSMPTSSTDETSSLHWVPFVHKATAVELVKRLSERSDVLHLLLEIETSPSKAAKDVIGDFLKIEEYGKPIAWKIDSHLAVLVLTDVEHLTKFLMHTFLQNNRLINEYLPLIRIESVAFEGKPQMYSQVAQYTTRKISRTNGNVQLTTNEWERHLEELRALCVFAHQANEYANKRKTPLSSTVKPDLIAHAKTVEDESDATAAAAASAVIELPKDDDENRQKPTLSQVPSKVANIAASVAAVVVIAPSLAEQTAQILPTGELLNSQKIKAKPTAIKRPIVVGDVKQSVNSTEEQHNTKSQAPEVDSSHHDFQASKSKSLSSFSLSKESIVSTTSFASISSSSSKAITIIANTKLDETIPQASLVTTSKISSVSPSSSPTKMLITAPCSPSNENDLKRPTKQQPKRPSLRRNKDSLLKESKPLNILIYSDSASAREGVVATLREILESDTYTIYAMTPQQVQQKHWIDNTALLVVCGPVAPLQLGQVMVDYFLNGGILLSLCSDILNFILPNYRTAEVREHELVQFSYDKWQKVRMMHHIFCYQPSPVRKNFSTDSEDSNHMQAKKSALLCPRSIELKDVEGILHSLEVHVLGTEETWNTPSLLLAKSNKSGGKALFSQIHLETTPNEFETDEFKFPILKQNEKYRLEIFTDLLCKHLGINVKPSGCPMEVSPSKRRIYQNAYFLGTYESKAVLLAKLKEKTGKSDNVISTSKLTMKFCEKDEIPPNANTNILPILIHSCPEDFSTVEYFESLKTNSIGRLVIYAPVVSSSMNVIEELDLMHGIAVLPRQQTDGVGRSNNQWLSPIGCAMFSLQVHISLDSILGSRLPLMQHILGAAIVNAFRSHTDYQYLDIALKWPNDIYADGVSKIGGLIIKTTLLEKMATVNIGCGLNLDNMKPTQCINDMIREFNKTRNQSIPPLKYEKFIAMIFNEIERLLDEVQNSKSFESFFKLYYDLWLHNHQIVHICDQDGSRKEAIVEGIDDYGYLKVKLSTGVIHTVQPDGNSFDILKGLIVPKFN